VHRVSRTCMHAYLHAHCVPVCCLTQIWMLLKPSTPDGSHSFAQRMSKDEYVAVFKRILSVVCPGLSPEEQWESIVSDWDKDRTEHGVQYDTLSHNRFFRCVFEIAGAWHVQWVHGGCGCDVAYRVCSAVHGLFRHLVRGGGVERVPRLPSSALHLHRQRWPALACRPYVVSSGQWLAYSGAPL